ncbi:hypothetical protein HYH03_012134 [Edaphochlamys debaryana]|uniref:Uncharacterized protein n=1 Tax=Edaphochlamys debaryana TaxID=47281 RepID=A0A835XQL1_9CHLO|nr:hypothetical protein HYH03_012134 [Edaphochlamys debaryana]|eukprot:KAG2489302.1 hypothetical protein HYH03_012134 [Edaphochlamys debaryana]
MGASMGRYYRATSLGLGAAPLMASAPPKLARGGGMLLRTGTQCRRANTDTVKLLMMGYRPELAREFTLFNCFGSSFTALSSLTALGGTYSIGLTYGGPVVMVWGWLLVVVMSTSVALSMAELASAYPTSGALYYWSFKLAPRRSRNILCWLTAWVLTMGQAAFTASNFYTFVSLVATTIRVQYDVDLGSPQRFLVLLGTWVVVGVLNCGSARLTAFMTTVGSLWHILALAAFCVAVPLMAPEKQSARYVFTSWQPNPDITGITSPVYTTLVGLLMSQWTLTGYDGSAHVAEETLHADVNVPRAIVLTVAGVGATGFAFILALTFVKVDVPALFDPGNETGGTNVVLQILIEVTKGRYGSVSAGVCLFTVVVVGTFFCANQSIANNSRMLYAFARDNGVPLSSYAKRVHPRTQAPVYGVLYMLFLSALLSTPMCFNPYVFPAVTSFAVVGCYLAYSLPVLCKLWNGRRGFLAGPFFLGPNVSYANNIVSVVWVGFVTILFCLPQYYPVTLLNMNWAGPILALALAFALGWYYLPVVGARKWFIGPRANLGQFQDVLPSERAKAAAEADAAEEAAAAAAGRACRAFEEAELLLARIAAGERSSGGERRHLSHHPHQHQHNPNGRHGHHNNGQQHPGRAANGGGSRPGSNHGGFSSQSNVVVSSGAHAEDRDPAVGYSTAIAGGGGAGGGGGGVAGLVARRGNSLSQLSPISPGLGVAAAPVSAEGGGGGGLLLVRVGSRTGSFRGAQLVSPGATGTGMAPSSGPLRNTSTGGSGGGAGGYAARSRGPSGAGVTQPSPLRVGSGTGMHGAASAGPSRLGSNHGMVAAAAGKGKSPSMSAQGFIPSAPVSSEAAAAVVRPHTAHAVPLTAAQHGALAQHGTRTQHGAAARRALLQQSSLGRHGAGPGSPPLVTAASARRHSALALPPPAPLAPTSREFAALLTDTGFASATAREAGPGAEGPAAAGVRQALLGLPPGLIQGSSGGSPRPAAPGAGAGAGAGGYNQQQQRKQASARRASVCSRPSLDQQWRPPSGAESGQGWAALLAAGASMASAMDSSQGFGSSSGQVRFPGLSGIGAPLLALGGQAREHILGGGGAGSGPGGPAAVSSPARGRGGHGGSGRAGTAGLAAADAAANAAASAAVVMHAAAAAVRAGGGVRDSSAAEVGGSTLSIGQLISNPLPSVILSDEPMTSIGASTAADHGSMGLAGSSAAEGIDSANRLSTRARLRRASVSVIAMPSGAVVAAAAAAAAAADASNAAQHRVALRRVSSGGLDGAASQGTVTAAGMLTAAAAVGAGPDVDGRPSGGRPSDRARMRRASVGGLGWSLQLPLMPGGAAGAAGASSAPLGTDFGAVTASERPSDGRSSLFSQMRSPALSAGLGPGSGPSAGPSRARLNPTSAETRASAGARARRSSIAAIGAAVSAAFTSLGGGLSSRAMPHYPFLLSTDSLSRVSEDGGLPRLLLELAEEQAGFEGGSGGLGGGGGDGRLTPHAPARASPHRAPVLGSVVSQARPEGARLTASLTMGDRSSGPGGRQPTKTGGAEAAPGGGEGGGGAAAGPGASAGHGSRSHTGMGAGSAVE